MPHRAPYSCACHALHSHVCHAPCGCVCHAPSTVAAASRAHSVLSSLPRAPMPRTLQWCLPQPPPASSTLAGLSVGAGTVCALRCIPQWITVRDTAADCCARCSGGLLCAMQWRIAVCDAAVDHYVQCSGGSLCATQQWIAVCNAVVDCCV